MLAIFVYWTDLSSLALRTSETCDFNHSALDLANGKTLGAARHQLFGSPR